MSDEARLLEELPVVRESLLVSVRQLTDDTPAVAADLTGWSESAATTALEQLVDAQLLYSPGPGRYACYSEYVRFLPVDGSNS